MSKVQILIPSYNAEKTLGQTVESLLAQTYKNFEILIVDNASTDNTEELVKSFKDDRVSYIKNEKNLGNYGNFDRCMSLARYDYTAIFHADDLYLPTILEEQVKILDSSPEVGAVFTEAIKVNNALEEIGIIRIPFHFRMKAKDHVVKFDFKSLLIGIVHHNCFLMAPSAIVRSKIYTNEIKRARVEYFSNAADIDIWIRISEHWKVAVITKALMKYRISPSQHTFNINRNRIVRSEFPLITNFYRNAFKDVLKNSDVAIKREKIIDLILRFESTEKGSRKFHQFRRIIIKGLMDIRLLRSPRVWKYFLKFLEIQFL